MRSVLTFPMRGRLTLAALTFAAFGAGLALAPALGAQRPRPSATRGAGAARPAPTRATPPAPPAPVGRLAGLLLDSLRGGRLIGARVVVGETGRAAASDADGMFHVDSVPPGEHVVRVAHPLLDSLQIALQSPPVRVVADSVTELVMTLPSLAALTGAGCTPAQMQRGPAVFAGRVLEADSKRPVAGARVTLVWMQLSAGNDIGLRQLPRVREAASDARGYYRICGIPAELEDATLQAERGRVKTAEVPITLRGETLVAVRSLLVRPLADSVATAGRAAISGRVVDTIGVPVASAQVSVEGASAIATTNARGEFRLDSLPSGTQAMMVRRVGFAPAATIVDLTAAEPARVAVKLARAVPRLERVVVAAKAEALSRVGFEERQKRGMGRYLGPEALESMQPQLVSSALRTLPGLRVVPTGRGSYTVQSSRDASGGCVNYWVDGAPFREMEPGDLDSAFPASQLAAIETYSAGQAPAQFTSAGQSSCAVVVIWTNATVRRRR